MRLIDILAVLGLLALAHILFVSAPYDFPAGNVVHIESGMSVGEAATKLKEANAIRSETLFKITVRLISASGVQAGLYALGEPVSVVTLAYRITQGNTGLDPVRVTIPEGTTISEIEDLLKVEIPREHEGYLFPDTYDFLPGSPSELIVERMRARYEEKVAPLRVRIAESGHTEEEIIIMASLLQKEARRHETMKTVAGILWKRIDIGMALQVDAVFGYIFDRPTYNPSGDDLEVDSPYNTYTNRGLPPGPIANPGLDAIIAAIEPTPSPYLYYLTGADGTMHYAKTFEQHVANRKFLK